ncbi:MAG TPA: BPSL0067 family protein [Geminicoccaceae bacterium]
MKFAPTGPIRRARWQTILARAGSIVVLAAVSACASHPPPVTARAQGPYFAARPEAFEGRVVGAGHCVDFVKAAAGAPQTSAWRKGAPVRGNPHIQRGTAVATFEADGTYTNASGNHAAIYLYQEERGIWVYDQWQGRPVHKRLIRFEGGRGSARGSKSNDGDRFAVIG